MTRTGTTVPSSSRTWCLHRGALTLEIGCGEGRVARDLATGDHSVVAVDTSPTLISAARQADDRVRCVRADVGVFEAKTEDAPFRIEGTYLDPQPYRESFERDGLRMTFSSTAYPLESYVNALEDAGLLIERLREPAVPDLAIRRDPAEARWARIPIFLFLRAVKQ